MTDLKIAYLGPEGTFSEMAADAYTATQSAVYAKHAIVAFKANNTCEAIYLAPRVTKI
eukprot:COSAG06_NODE_56158_length_286_cov_0.764706_2_plen_57_part_01